MAARAVAQPRGEWPRPALAVLTGNMAPGDMLRVLERKTGDELKLGLSEAYFYLGQHYLGLGDKTKARHYFEETRRLNVLIYTEHTAAAFELQRLRASTETGALPQNPIETTVPPPVSKATTGDPASTPAASKSAPIPTRRSPQSWNKDIWKQ